MSGRPPVSPPIVPPRPQDRNLTNREQVAVRLLERLIGPKGMPTYTHMDRAEAVSRAVDLTDRLFAKLKGD